MGLRFELATRMNFFPRGSFSSLALRHDMPPWLAPQATQ